MMKPKTKADLLKYLKDNPNLECTQHPLPQRLGPVTVSKVQTNGLEFSRPHLLVDHPGWIYWDRVPARFTFSDVGFTIVQDGHTLTFLYKDKPND